MIDPHAIVEGFLAVQTDLVGVLLYTGEDVPPPGYSPGDSGDCITFKVRGGDSDYEDALLRPSMQFKCYGASGGVPTTAASYALYRTLHDVLHGARSAEILHCERETLGQPLREPDTEWPFVLVHFRFLLRQSE